MAQPDTKRRRRALKPGDRLAAFPGDSDDPAGFPRLVGLFLEAMAVKGFSPGTLTGHRARLELFCRWAAEHGLSRPREITRPIVERYQRHLFYYRKKSGRPLAFPTQQQRLISLRSLFRWLARQNLVLYNPAAELETPRLPRSLPKHVLTASEVEQLLVAFQSPRPAPFHEC
ncbi:MAG: site-specific integrase [Candidatus Wallbacteria bacterium]|nr:site-specific integrase [Candidatus Wallbacteria bacterium]